jgi:hypothetical protein
MAKIFLATPAYDGRVHVPFAISLSETHTLLASKGIEFQVQIHCAGSLLTAERNRLLEAFINSDATHLLCVDSDLGWPAQAVIALLDHDVDFVCGVYPTRKDNMFLFRPIYNEDKSVVKNEKGLLKVEYIPAGFMMIKREVIVKMREFHSNLKFTPKVETEQMFSGYFDTEVWQGEFWGEDFYFCRKARETGFDIWVDPLIEFDHAGVRGMLLSVLSNQKPNMKSEEPVFIVR